MTPKQKAAMVFREIKVGEYVLRFWPSDKGWVCGITPEMMQALAEQPAQQQEEPKRWAVFCSQCRKEWSVSYPHPGKSICAECDAKVEAQQQERVMWGVEWGRAGDQPCVSIIQRLPGGGIEVLATEYGPPASKPWQALTNDEIALLNADYPHPQGFARALEAKLKEKNT